MGQDGRYIYKVSELTSSIKLILEDSFPNIWVEGEISNLKSPSSGHIYFTLKDDRSELKSVFFKSDNEKIKFDIVLKKEVQLNSEGTACMVHLLESVHGRIRGFQFEHYQALFVGERHIDDCR